MTPCKLLSPRKREHKLEEIQADIEYQMRCVISKQGNSLHLGVDHCYHFNFTMLSRSEDRGGREERRATAQEIDGDYRREE